jgi:hypothetical protein
MSLLDVLSGVKLVAIDDDAHLAFAWFGDQSVYGFNREGHLMRYARIATTNGRQPTVKMVRAAIARLRAQGK